MTKRYLAALLVLVPALALAACQRSGAKPDRGFDTSVATPAYASDGPVVLIDEADAARLPLPDQLHPDAETHRRIGERFAEHPLLR